MVAIIMIWIMNCAVLYAQTVAPTIPTQEAVPTEPPKTEPSKVEPLEISRSKYHRVRGLLSIGYNSATSINFNSATFDSGSGSDSGHDNFLVDSAFQISLGAIYSPEHKWGLSGMYTMEGKRDVKFEHMQMSSSAIDLVYTSARPTVQFNLIEANAIYRWNYMYLPFGLNYSYPTVTAVANSNQHLEYNGGLGLQFGLGFIAGEYFRFDILAQTIGFHLISTSDAILIDYGLGYLSGVTFRTSLAF